MKKSLKKRGKHKKTVNKDWKHTQKRKNDWRTTKTPGRKSEKLVWNAENMALLYIRVCVSNTHKLSRTDFDYYSNEAHSICKRMCVVCVCVRYLCVDHCWWLQSLWKSVAFPCKAQSPSTTSPCRRFVSSWMTAASNTSAVKSRRKWNVCVSPSSVSRAPFTARVVAVPPAPVYRCVCVYAILSVSFIHFVESNQLVSA